MKKISQIIGLLTVGLLAISSYAQSSSYKFGTCNPEDFKTKECPFEPGASAVILCDIGKSMFEETDYGFFVYFERRVKIKILNKAGLQYAEFNVPVYTGDEGSEKIIEIVGNTYNFENGTIRTTAFNPKESYTKKLNEHWDLKTFAIPDVSEGSVFEVKYEIRSPYIFNLRDWEFQCEIPVYYSEYTAEINPHFDYTYFVQGVNKFDEFKSYPLRKEMQIPGIANNDDMAYFFVLKNIQSFKKDEYITSADDYRIKINFQLSGYANSSGSVTRIITTWPELTKDLLKQETFGKYIKLSLKKAEELIPTLNLPSGNLEKTKYLRWYVTNNYNFNGYDTYFTKNSVKDLLTKKTGNSADLNLFLLGLLRMAGIQADPVIISTRDHGKIKADYPFTDAFNYVLIAANIDGKIQLMDATDPLLNFNEIPPRCLNETGLIVKDGEPQWVKFTSTVISEQLTLAEFNLEKESGNVTIKYTNVYSGYDASSMRGQYLADYNALHKKLISVRTEINDSLKAKNLQTVEEKFELSYQEQYHPEITDGMILIDPFFGKAMYENPFKEPTRSYPVDFNYKKKRSFETDINIPEGYKLIGKPEDLIVNNLLMKVIYTVDESKPGKIKVTAQYEIKKDSYPAESYKELKGYFDLIVNKFNEKIIFEPVGI